MALKVYKKIAKINGLLYWHTLEQTWAEIVNLNYDTMGFYLMLKLNVRALMEDLSNCFIRDKTPFLIPK